MFVRKSLLKTVLTCTLCFSIFSIEIFTMFVLAPSPNIYVIVNPIKFHFDATTTLWLHAFLRNMQKMLVKSALLYLLICSENNFLLIDFRICQNLRDQATTQTFVWKL